MGRFVAGNWEGRLRLALIKPDIHGLLEGLHRHSWQLIDYGARPDTRQPTIRPPSARHVGWQGDSFSRMLCETLAVNSACVTPTRSGSSK